ncbi:MAG: hypothetical protein PHY47_25005 [Lachnospiraceae bacterium]|nr:hypothetical protein [Lachnospiraceae bacterium]
MSNYLDSIEESTNIVKSRIKLSKLILITSYLAVWVISLIVFWYFTSGSDAMGYGIVFLWVLLPCTTFVISILIGKNDYWGKYKWITSIAFGVMYMLAEYATFSAANMISFDKVNMPQFSMIFIGAVISIAGLEIGVGIRRFKSKNLNK